MAQSLQIKRNKNIFQTKEDAVNHLNSLVNKLEDGEIVLCRYFNDNTVQTLIGFQTKYGIVNENTSENEIVNTITYLDSFSEVGNGFSRDEKGVLQVKLDNSGINFLKNSENGLKVDSMEANVTTITKDIQVVGGPLASEKLQNILKDTDDAGNKIIKSGTNIQDLLITLFCKEEYPTNYKSTSGSVSSYINAPILTLSNENSNVEVGTKITATMSFNGNSVAKIIDSSVTDLTYGYVKDSISYDKNKITETPLTSYTETTKAKLSYTINNGFISADTKNPITSTTVTEQFENVNLGQVDDGENKITLYVSGQSITYNCNEIKSVYPKSNVGNTAQTIVTTYVESFSGITTVPTSATSITINGIRYGFYGIIEDDPEVVGQETFDYTSENIRNLTPLISATDFTINGDNVGRVIIAIPNSWGKEIEKITDANQMGNDLWDSSLGYATTPYNAETNPNGMREMDIDGANGYTASKYKVYTYDPGQSISIKQTVTFKK